MTKESKNIYEFYKPLKNHLGKCELMESLFVIKAYAQNLQFNSSSFPTDIEVDSNFLQEDHIQKIRLISEWNLEILAKEVIINSPLSIWDAKTFRHSACFMGAINKLKNIENKIVKDHIDSSNIFREIERMAHGQFSWQIARPNAELMAVYYKIYSDPTVDSIIKNAIGITTKEIYLIGSAFLGSFLKNFALQYPLKIEIPGLNQGSVDKFLKHFSSELDSLKEKLISEQNLDEKYFYSFSSLRSYPIIKMDNEGKYSLICPIPTLLFWRITGGLYYEILNEKYFDNAFGASFQKYIGDCIRVSKKNRKIFIFSEETFMDGKNRKDTVDWIIDDGSSALFVECKTKRITMPSKIELIAGDSLEKDLDKMATFVVQIYKTIKDYKANKYPSYKYDVEKKIYPVVVTLEDWHLFGESTLLKNKIEEKLRAENISMNFLLDMPYTICSAQEFKDMIQIIQTKGIEKVVGKKIKDIQKVKWAMANFLSSEYPSDYKKIESLFLKDFYSIFPNDVSN